MTESHDRPLSVLHCFRPIVGGVFRHVRDLVREQAGQGFNVGVICDVGPGSREADVQLGDLTEYCSLGVHRMPIRRLPHPGDVLNQRRLRAIVNDAEADVVHGHGAKGGVLARMVAVSQRTSVIYSPHGGVLHFQPSSASGRLFHGLERFLLPRTDGLIFVCDFEATRYRELIGASNVRSTVVHNGLYQHEWSVPAPVPEDSYDFVFVGELRELKGVATLCGAIERLREERPVRLLIVGDGPDAERFQSSVSSRELRNAITFAPPVRHAVDAFGRGRCVVVPSHAESFPYVVLEAAAAAKPLVATDVGGIPEIFGPDAARLVPPRDVTALAGRLRRVLVDPAAAEREAAHLAVHVRSHFTVEAMASSIMQFYREVRTGDSASIGESA